MDALERHMREAEVWVDSLPYSTVRKLARSLKQLDLEQQLFVRRTLHKARESMQSPTKTIDTLEYLVDRWWTHSLATKIALLSCVAGLSDDGHDAEPFDRTVAFATLPVSAN